MGDPSKAIVFLLALRINWRICEDVQKNEKLYFDTCEYNNTHEANEKCGDLCTGEICSCGADKFSPKYSENYCCIPSNETCTKHIYKVTKIFQSEIQHWHPVCQQGKMLPMSSPCDNLERSLQCYNSYQDSQHIGWFSHFTCPGACVSWADMCQGVSWCPGDHRVCGPQLRCPRGWEASTGVKRSLSSSLAPDHHYCLADEEGKSNNGVYDNFDRSDETEMRSEGFCDIDTRKFTSCLTNDSYQYPGVMCGSECRRSDKWCVKRNADTCGAENINTLDSRLCGNPLVWRGVSCDKRNGQGVLTEGGLRCRGTRQHCYQPWYTLDDGDSGRMPETCSDKSDQVFQIGKTCREHLLENIDFHNNLFCSGRDDVKSYARSKLICTNTTVWVSEQDNSKKDPHFCQESCLSPGPDCVACTNPEYFHCTEAGLCVHPDLECDGHPQCPGGEDEGLEKCHKKYIDNKIVQPFASYKCKSLFYEAVEIYATPCNNVVECFDGSDESHCQEDKIMTYILAGSSIGIILLYFTLRIYKHHEEESGGQPLLGDQAELHFLQKYETDHNDPDIIKEVNVRLFHTIYTKNVETSRVICCQFYDMETRVHGGRESEIYFCLHKNLDPLIVDDIIDFKFPGFLDTTMEWIQLFMWTKRFTNLKDMILKKGKLSHCLAVINSIISLEAKYIDLFKDTALTFYILSLVGGLQSIRDLPTNFTSVIVITMMSSILIPLLLSSFHLAMNNPLFIWKMLGRKSSSTSIWKSRVLCFMFSGLNPIFLNKIYEESKEETRMLAEKLNHGVIKAMKKCKTFKLQLVEFHKIELGTEVFVQISLQILILLLARTETPTTGGLETIFNKESSGYHPIFVLFVSISVSLVSCIKLHTSFVVAEKVFFPPESIFCVLLWGTFAALRRTLSIIALFIPSMGLVSILHHWKREQIPFRIRLDLSEKLGIRTDDKIGLYGLNETIYWSELDRWSYTDPVTPTPPPYSLYTMMTLQETFVAGLILLFIHTLTLYFVKNITSTDFREEKLMINKIIHILENLNYATPFKDWDMGQLNIAAYKTRFQALKREMMATFTVNFIVTIMMVIPLLFTGNLCTIIHVIFASFSFVVSETTKRHSLLRKLMRTKANENLSYENAINCGVFLIAGILSCSLLEVAAYFIYSYKVRP